MDQKQRAYYRERGLGSYAEVAKDLTAQFGIQPAVDRRTVQNWHTRGTLNAAGEPFPDPAYEFPAERTQPRWIFRFADVRAWLKAGVPGRHANQNEGRWRQLAE